MSNVPLKTEFAEFRSPNRGVTLGHRIWPSLFLAEPSKEFHVGEAAPCRNCGGKKLMFKENSETDEHWVHCDTCGQIGPVKGSVPEAGDAWNEANKVKG